MGNTIVEFKNVMKQYGQGEAIQLANNDVNFTIDEGEFVVILGQSGAGKSTVLNMLGGMDTPTSGTITVAGQEICDFVCRSAFDQLADGFQVAVAAAGVDQIMQPAVFVDVEVDGHGTNAFRVIMMMHRCSHRPFYV